MLSSAKQLIHSMLPLSAATSPSNCSNLWVALIRAGSAIQITDSSSSSSCPQSQPWSSVQVRTATKKAGGTAKQTHDTKSRNLGVKLLHDEVIFPGQIVVRQRGTKYHPGYNVGLGKDHTIFATSVGRVHFSKETVQYMGGRTKERTLVSVVPLNGDWSPAYRRLEEVAIERRAAIKRKLLKAHAHEAALFFPLPRPSPPLHIVLPPSLPTPGAPAQTPNASAPTLKGASKLQAKAKAQA